MPDDGRPGFKGRQIRLDALALATLVVCATPLALARAASSGPAHSPSSHSKTVPDVARDSRGKIARSPQALHAFKNAHPCPATGKTHGACSGYVVDHVVPLKRGGADSPSNMQWQTTVDAKAKDKWE